MPFFGTWKRALSLKVPVFKCQKMAPWAPKSKIGLQKPRETPPKMVGYTFGSCLSVFGWVLSQLWKIAFFYAVFDPFYYVNEAKLQTSFHSWKRRPRFFNFFVLFLHIKRHKKNTQAKVLEKIASWQHALMSKLSRSIQDLKNLKSSNLTLSSPRTKPLSAVL